MVCAVVCVLLAGADPVAAKNCTKYRPAGCLFSTVGKRPIDYPAPMHPISFNFPKEIACPFYASGMFEAASEEVCTDDFMTEVQRFPPRVATQIACAGGGVSLLLLGASVGGSSQSWQGPRAGQAGATQV